MTLVAVLKYLLPLTLFFYGTLIFNFIRDTHYNTQRVFHVSVSSKFSSILLSAINRNASNRNVNLWEVDVNFRKYMFSNMTTAKTNKNKSKVGLSTTSDNHTRDKFTTVKDNFPIIWSAYDEIKLRSNQIRRNRQHSFQQVGSNIYVFSAFFDNRQLAIYNESLVRVIAIARLDSKESLICRIKTETTDLTADAVKTEMSDNHEKIFGGIMYTCKIPQGFGRMPPKFIYFQRMNIQTDSFSKVTNKLISLPAVKVKLFPEETRHGEKIFGATDVHSSDSLHSLESERNKSLEENTKKLQNAINQTFQERQLLKMNKTSNAQLSPKISVCVSPLFGPVKLVDLIQFIEMHLILGVSHFFFYKMDVSKEVDLMLGFYQAKGVVTVSDWILPAELQSSSSQIWYNGQVVALQDCLYRNMGYYGYTAFLDIDEVIVPYQDTNWAQMLQTVENFQQSLGSTITDFIFKSAFFQPDVSDADIDPRIKGSFNKLSFLKNVYRNDIISSVRTKVILQPEYIVQIGVHHVSKLISSAKSRKSVAVNTSTALIHHYRKCTQVSDDQMHCGKYVKDGSMLKYANLLLKNYENVLEEYLSLYRGVK